MENKSTCFSKEEKNEIITIYVVFFFFVFIGIYVGNKLDFFMSGLIFSFLFSILGICFIAAALAIKLLIENKLEKRRF